MGREWSSLVRHLPSIREALDLIPSTTKEKRKKGEMVVNLMNKWKDSSFLILLPLKEF